ncbi:MAG: PKD domain-containing protein [Bacteroidales bacterium]|nr:PKD domain-containing protein [Bacteroidales bacterium]MCF8458818.1 PKD domain-containing protein [Bacteroidales bacterium]
MKKGIFTLIGIIVISLSLMSQQPKFEWANSFTGTNVIGGYALDFDQYGNVYSVGFFMGTVDFDPGLGQYALTSNGSADIYISKLDSSGNFVWAKSIGGTGDDRANSIAADSIGNLYITGEFTGNVDFNPNPGTTNLSSNGQSDIFILRIDWDGNLVWAKNIGGTSYDIGKGIAQNNLGEIVCVGSFESYMDFDPGPGSYILPSSGGEDAFILKLTSTGTYVWGKSIAGLSDIAATGIDFDINNNIAISGYFVGTADFDPGFTTYDLTASGGSKAFVLRINSAGEFCWAKKIGTWNHCGGNDVAVDLNGNVYTTGYVGIQSSYKNQIYISKTDSSGIDQWTNFIHDANYYNSSRSYSVAVDISGNVYITGIYQYYTDFDPGTGTYILNAVNSDDIFICKLNTLGNFEWARSIGGQGIDQGVGIKVDNNDNIYLTGMYAVAADFDPNLTVYNLSGSGTYKGFVLKLSQTVHPIAQFSASNTLITKGDTANFFDQSLNNPVSWHWNFGDGTTSNLENPTHIYQDPAAYTVTLIASDSIKGDTLILEKYLKVMDHTPPYTWAKSIGGSSSDLVKASAVDAAGNFFHTGGFYGTVDFDPGAGISNLTSNGNTDIYITKVSPAGDFLWAKKIGGTNYENGECISIDNEGYVIVTGNFTGTVDFDPGPGTNYITSSNTGTFILKLDSLGNHVFAKGISSNWAYNFAMCTDNMNNIYITGRFSVQTDFDPSAGTSIINPTGVEDVYVCKFSESGAFVWAKNFGGSSATTSCYGIGVDANQNVYITGWFKGTVDFDPGSGSFNLTSDYLPIFYDIFITKLNSNGEFVWAKSIGEEGQSEIAVSIEIDSQDNIYLAGGFGSTVDFDPDTGVYELSTSTSSTDAFLLKLDSNGSFNWVRSYGSYNAKSCEALTIDDSDNIYSTGYFEHTTNFYYAIDTFELTSSGQYDVFVCKHDPTGHLLWATKLGGTSTEKAYTVSVHNQGGVYVAGTFYGVSDFDPGPAFNYLGSNGDNDIFTLKLTQPEHLDAHFSSSHTIAVIGQNIQFMDNSYGAPLTWLWNFGDGTTDTLQNPFHIYQTPGTYTVSLTVSDSSLTDSIVKPDLITVQEPIVASFTVSDTLIDLGQMVNFTDQSSGSPTNWLWDFGDGTTSNLQSPVHYYQNADTFSVSLIASNSLSSDTIIYPDYLQVIDTIPFPLPWTYTQTSGNHIILFAAGTPVLIDNVPLSPGDFVGVFYDDNGLLKCGGYTEYTTDIFPVTAWGDDNTTSTKDGFAANESFHWKCWRMSDGLETDLTATYDLYFPNQGNFFTNGMSAVVSLEGSAPSVTEQQIIVLSGTWSMFSTYIQPVLPDIEDVLNQIVGNVIIVKDGNGMSFWPQYGVNLIGNITPGEGFQIKMTISDTLIIEGSVILPDTVSIELPVAWSILGYLRTAPASIVEMLSPVINQVIIVKDGNGMSYWPQYGVNLIGNMQPGQGYQIKMSSAQTLIYPANTIGSKIVIQPTSFSLPAIKNTGSNMTLGLQSKGLETGQEILVYSQSGLIVGAGLVQDGFTVITLWGDDETTPEIDGLAEGEEFIIKLTNGEFLTVNTWQEGDGKYGKNKISVAGNYTYKEDDLFSHIKIYPNPTDYKLYIDLGQSLPIGKLELINIYGQVLLEKEISNEYLVEMEIRHLPAGEYFVRVIVAGEQVFVEKVVKE